MVFQSKSPKITLICLNVFKSLNNFLFASYHFLQLAIIKVKVDALLLSTNEIRIPTNMPWQNSFYIASFLGPFGQNIPIQIGKITCQIARFPRNFFSQIKRQNAAFVSILWVFYNWCHSSRLVPDMKQFPWKVPSIGW